MRKKILQKCIEVLKEENPKVQYALDLLNALVDLIDEQDIKSESLAATVE